MSNDIYKDYEFDEEDDIVLPDTFWGELVYIKFILIDIFKTPQNRKLKFKHLQRQIGFFWLWMKNK